jgi:hypothetical protein
MPFKTVTAKKPKQSDIQWRTKLPAELNVANLLPGHILDVPDFRPRDRSWGRPRQGGILVALRHGPALAARASLRGNLSFALGCADRQSETAQFERFLDEHFPRAKFDEFRRYIDNPPYLPGVCIASDPKPSKILTYRMLIENRRQWRAAAHKNHLIAVMTGQTLPLGPRICEFCELVFVARRKDQLTCDDTCASGRRMRRKRAKAKEYELNRQLKKAAREYQLRLVRKENEREKQRKAR